jgi:hypothetical protein
VAADKGDQADAYGHKAVKWAITAQLPATPTRGRYGVE